MKLLKNSTYDGLIKSVSDAAIELDSLTRRYNFVVKESKQQVDEIAALEKIVAEFKSRSENSEKRIKRLLETHQFAKESIKAANAEIASLKQKAEKWDAELQRQRDKQKRRREKVKLQSGIEKFVTKNLGLKMEVCGSVGHICGYNKNENVLIVGFENNNDSNLKWTEGAINENDTLLVNHNFYMTTPLDINTKIIK